MSMKLSELYADLRGACLTWRTTILGAVTRTTRPSTGSPLVDATLDLTRSRMELVAENAFLRQQVVVLLRSVKRPTLRERDRLALVILARLNRRWRTALLIVQPKTSRTASGPATFFRRTTSCSARSSYSSSSPTEAGR
jgi:hypothetical protein